MEPKTHLGESNQSSIKNGKKKELSYEAPIEIEKPKEDLASSQEDGIVVRELKNLNKTKLLPIERQYLFHKFNHSEILDCELQAKPTILLVGQYSTGKTSFIRHLIGMDYPDIHIGPEPTTDKFVAVVHGEETKVIPGNALTGVTDLPFSGLSCFGSSFLTKVTAAVVPSPFLKDVNIIDTPGVLSGEKQRTARGYDFSKVCRWFAERSDLILLMFDCSKLDISDEFKSVIEELQPHEDKVHCVLNKADQLNVESLMRVYGALLWSMGRIFKGAEVTRVYIGCFGGPTYLTGEEEHLKIFARDKEVLMSHLTHLPSACSMRKINELVKRVRSLIVHVCLLGHLKSKMPVLWGGERAQKELVRTLRKTFDDVREVYQLAEGDFPKLEEFQATLALCDISKFPREDRDVLILLQDILTVDIPRITSLVAGVVDEGPGSRSLLPPSTQLASLCCWMSTALWDSPGLGKFSYFFHDYMDSLKEWEEFIYLSFSQHPLQCCVFFTKLVFILSIFVFVLPKCFFFGYLIFRSILIDIFNLIFFILVELRYSFSLF